MLQGFFCNLKRAGVIAHAFGLHDAVSAIFACTSARVDTCRLVC